MNQNSVLGLESAAQFTLSTPTPNLKSHIVRYCIVLLFMRLHCLSVSAYVRFLFLSNAEEIGLAKWFLLATLFFSAMISYLNILAASDCMGSENQILTYIK